MEEELDLLEDIENCADTVKSAKFNLDYQTNGWEAKRIQDQINSAASNLAMAQTALNEALYKSIKSLLNRVAVLEEIEKKRSDVLAENITIDLKD